MKAMLKGMLIAAVLSCAPLVAAAADEPVTAAGELPTGKAAREAIKDWLAAEATILGLSAVVSGDPEDWGRVMCFMAPFALLGDQRNPGSNVPVLAGALILALGLYNVRELSDKERYGYNHAFRRNEIALHGIVLGGMAFATLEQDRPSRQPRVGALVLDDGGMLRVSYSF